jgi:hypothetical protein
VAPAAGGCATVALTDIPPQNEGCKCDSSAPGGLLPLLAGLAAFAARRLRGTPRAPAPRRPRAA